MRIVAVLCKFVEDAARQFGFARRQSKGNECLMLAGVFHELGLCKVCVERSKVAVDIHIVRTGGLAVRPGVHKDRAFFGEQRVGVRGRQCMCADLAATHGDMRVLACLKAGADDVHVEPTVHRDARVIVFFIFELAAESCVDAAHAIVRGRFGGSVASRRRSRVLHAHFEVAVDGQLSAFIKEDSRDIVVPSAVRHAGTGDIDERVAFPRLLLVLPDRCSDGLLVCVLFDGFYRSERRIGRLCRVEALACSVVELDVACLGRGRRC